MAYKKVYHVHSHFLPFVGPSTKKLVKLFKKMHLAKAYNKVFYVHNTFLDEKNNAICVLHRSTKYVPGKGLQ